MMWTRWLTAALAAGALWGAAPLLAQEGEGLSAEALLAQAREQLKQNDPEEAARTFRAAATRDPKAQDAWDGLGKALIKLQRWEDAIAAYEDAHAALPDWEEPLYRLGYLHRKKADYARAIDYYKQYIEKNQDNPDAYFGLGESYRKRDQPREAIAAFEIYVQKETRPAEKKWVERAREMIKALEGQVGEGEEAVAEAPAQADEAPSGDASALLAKGDLAYQEQNLKRAAQLYQAAARKDQGVEALYKLGVVQALLGDLPGAAASWQAVLERDPSMALAKDRLARARQKMKVQAEQGVDDPALAQDLEARLTLAQRYLDEGRLPMAMRVLDPLTDQNPEEARVRLLRGRALMQLGRFEEARQSLELSLGADPADPKVMDALGQVYLRLDDESRALYYLRLYLQRADPEGRDPALEPTRRTVARLSGADAP